IEAERRNRRNRAGSPTSPESGSSDHGDFARLRRFRRFSDLERRNVRAFRSLTPGAETRLISSTKHTRPKTLSPKIKLVRALVVAERENWQDHIDSLANAHDHF